MLKLSRIQIAGFRGFRDSATIDVPAGFLVITGPNGSGKSSVCDAVEGAPTGGVGRQVGHTESGERLEDYFWWRGKGPARERFVELTLSDGGRTAAVVRRDAAGKCSLSDRELEMLLCMRGSAPSQPVREFFKAALLRGESVSELSVEMPEAERFTLIREAVGGSGLVDFERVLVESVSVAKSRYAAAKASYDSARERAAISVERASAEQARAARVGRDDTALKETAVLLGVEPLDLRSVVVRGPTALAERLAVRASLERLASDTEAELGAFRQYESESATAERAVKQREVNAVREEIARRNAELRDVEKTINAGRTAEKSAVLLAQLVEAGSALGLQESRCPLCGSVVSREQLASHIAEIRQGLARKGLDAAAMAKRQTELRRRLSSLRHDLERHLQEIEFADAVPKQLDQRQHHLMKTAADLGVTGVDRFDQMMDALSKRLDVVRQQARVLQSGIALAEAAIALTRVEELDRGVATAKHELAEAEREVGSRGLGLERLQGALSRVRRLAGELTEQRLAGIFPVLTEFYERLQPHPDWPSVEYRMRGDVRKFLSLRVGETANPRFLFSSGQRRTLGLAFLLAVHATTGWCQLDSLLLDDPAQHIDDFRALQLVETLGSIRLLGKQVVTTIEDAALADLLCRRLRSKPGEGGSFLRLEYKLGVGTQIAESRQIDPFRGAERQVV